MRKLIAFVIAILAFPAMAQYQLGHKDQARTLLERLRAALNEPQGANASESEGFLREAEALLAGKKLEPRK